jgi:hypothetical protein
LNPVRTPVFRCVGHEWVTPLGSNGLVGQPLRPPIRARDPRGSRANSQDLSLGTGCAQAPGQPVDLRIPVQRGLTPCHRAPCARIEPVGQLAVVNAKFDTGIPPTADQYEVVVDD